MIPKELKPGNLFNLIRLGKNNDGGYLICKNSLEKSNCLVSFGISNDFSFEENFNKLNNIRVFAFDPTVTNKFFLKNIITSLLKFNLKFFFNNVLNYLNFKKFFNNKENLFFKKKIGKGGNINFPYVSIADIVKLTNNNSQIFFKIDIEGAEYRILDDLIERSNIISGIAIEFHDVDLHIERIIKFIKNINLTLVHIHANNWGDYGNNNIPSILELSFSKNPELISHDLSFPHKLDQKNNPDVKDLELIFEE